MGVGGLTAKVHQETGDATHKRPTAAAGPHSSIDPTQAPATAHARPVTGNKARQPRAAGRWELMSHRCDGHRPGREPGEAARETTEGAAQGHCFTGEEGSRQSRAEF